jgi:hypothetical protein
MSIFQSLTPTLGGHLVKGIPAGNVGGTPLGARPGTLYIHIKIIIFALFISFSSYPFRIQNVPEGKINYLRGYNIGHSKQKLHNIHASYSERFPKQNYFTEQYRNC